MGAKKTSKKKHNGFCTFEGCNKKYWAKGFCGMHYKRFVRHGDPIVKKVNQYK